MSDTEAIYERDASEVRQVRAGNFRAYEDLVERYYGSVFAIIYSILGQREAAEELAQDVFLRGLLQIHLLREPRTFAAWILRIARNLALDWRKKSQRASRLVQLVELEAERGRLVTREPLVREKLEQQQGAKALAEAILQLPPAQHQVVVLHYFEGLSPSETARQLGLRPSTVSRQLERALRTLRDSLLIDPVPQMQSLRVQSSGKPRTAVLVAAVGLMSAQQRSALAKTFALPYTSPLVEAAGAVRTTCYTMAATGLIGVVVLLLQWQAGNGESVAKQSSEKGSPTGGMVQLPHQTSDDALATSPSREVTDNLHTPAEHRGPTLFTATADAAPVGLSSESATTSNTLLAEVADAVPARKPFVTAAHTDLGSGTLEGALAGRVVTLMGKGIPGALLEVRNGAERRVGQSDVEGTFRIDGLTTGNVSVVAWANGYTTTTKESVPVGRENLTLILAEVPYVRYEVLLIDERTLQPIPDFEVFVETPGASFEAPAGTAGLVFPRVDSTIPLRFRITAPGYAPYDTGPVRLNPEPLTQRVHISLGSGGSVAGRVVSRDREERPLPGVRVEVRPTGDRAETGAALVTGTTDGAGRFQLRQVPSGSWTLLAAGGTPRAVTSRDFKIDRSRDTDVGDIRLGESPRTRVTGKVLLEPGKQALQGIDVRLAREDGTNAPRSAISGSAGEFDFDSVEPGRYIIRVPDYRTALGVVVVEGDAPKEVLVTVGAGRLEGRVTARGRAVPALIRLKQTAHHYPRQTKTQDDGTFVLDTLAPGRWTAEILPNGQLQGIKRFPVDVLEERTTVAEFRVEGASLSGKVLDASEAPVVGATVTASWEPTGLPVQKRTATSSSDGSFALHDLPSGRCAVVAQASGDPPAVSRVESLNVSTEGDPRPLLLRLTTAGGTLHSVCYNMADGSGIPSAWCFLDSAAGPFVHSEQRSAAGEITIRNIPPGTYRVRVGASGFSNKVHEVTIRAGDQVNLEDVLYEAGTASIQVITQGGEAAARVSVEIRPLDPNSVQEPRKGLTDALGNWLMRGLMPGAYHLSVNPQSAEPLIQEIIIRPRQVTTTEVHLTK